MSEPNDEPGSAESEHPGSAESPSRSADPDARPPSIVSGIVVLAMGTIAAIWVQTSAPDFDYQQANIFSAAAFGLSVCFFLFRLHRRFSFFDHDRLLPLTVVAAAAIFFANFRFVGFSGELLPQFEWRFKTSPVGELPTVSSSTASPVLPATAEPTSDQRNQSTQFLGPNRNGVHDKRAFRIPERREEVEVLWDQAIGDGWSSFAVSDSLAVTIEQRDGEECLTCYSLDSGELLWMQRHGGRHENLMGGVGPRSTPTIAEDRIYASSATGLLWCVETTTGDVIWKRDLLEMAGWDQTEFETAAPWGYSISPLLVDDLCVVALGGPVSGDLSASLSALDKNTGDPIWTAGSDQLSYASPILAELEGTRQIVSVNEKTVTGHAIDDGKVLWEFEWVGATNTGANCASAVPVADNRLLLGKGYGGGSALMEVSRSEDAWKAEAVWRSQRVLQTKFNHTCVRGEVGFGIGNGALQAVDLSESQPRRLWIQPRRSRSGQGQTLLVEDVLVVQDESGEVVFVEASRDEYIERFRMEALGSKTWNIPTIAGRYLLVRNDQRAICYRLPSRD